MDNKFYYGIGFKNNSGGFEIPDRSDFVILNSVSFFEKARPFMERHAGVRLYLDRDATGRKCTRHALSLSTKYRDDSCLYKHHKDLNDWAMNFGKSLRKAKGRKYDSLRVDKARQRWINF